MKRKELKIIAISYSQTQVGSYVVVLSEIKGNRKIPVIVNTNDAQQIALKLENMKSPRPLTHDLFKSMTDSFGIDIKEVFIQSVVEGILYCRLITSNGIDDIEIESSLGDGLCLSLIYNCPLMVASDVIDSAGININDDGSEPEYDDDDFDIESPEEMKKEASIEELERLMNNALENEEYEIAAGIRDRINQLKEENG